MLIDGAVAPFNFLDLAASFLKLSDLLSYLLSVHFSPPIDHSATLTL